MNSIASVLGKIAKTTRVAGADRYATAVAVSKKFHTTTSTTAVIASGANFPDALVGAVLAGTDKAPLYLSQTTCMPSTVVSELSRLKATSILLMGGTAVLSNNVAARKHC